MDAKTCIQMEKICRAYRLGKCHDKFIPFTTVVAHVIGTHTPIRRVHRHSNLCNEAAWTLYTLTPPPHHPYTQPGPHTSSELPTPLQYLDPTVDNSRPSTHWIPHPLDPPPPTAHHLDFHTPRPHTANLPHIPLKSYTPRGPLKRPHPLYPHPLDLA